LPIRSKPIHIPTQIVVRLQIVVEAVLCAKGVLIKDKESVFARCEKK